VVEEFDHVVDIVGVVAGGGGNVGVAGEVGQTDYDIAQSGSALQPPFDIMP
jgi:hypothetical protein